MRRQRVVELDDVPELVDPVVIAAFEGWNDAGEAASGVIQHLEESWDATPLAALDPDDYYDFQVTRPTVEMVDGETRRISWPTTRLSLAKLARLRPRRRARSTASSRTCAGGRSARTSWASCWSSASRRPCCSGALLADAPHTRPVPVTAAASDTGLTDAPAARTGPLRGPDRRARRAPGRVRDRRAGDGVAVGGGAALRRPAALPQGHAGAAALGGGPPGRLGADGRAARAGPRLGARRQRARRAGHRGRRVRPRAGGAEGRHRAARGQRRRHRAGVRALPPPPRRRATDLEA